MSSVVKEIRAKPNEEVVRGLEEALERARQGETTGILLVEQDRDGASYFIAGMRDRFQKLGVLSHAMHKLQTDGDL